jgi:putative lipoprotein
LRRKRARIIVAIPRKSANPSRTGITPTPELHPKLAHPLPFVHASGATLAGELRYVSFFGGLVMRHLSIVALIALGLLAGCNQPGNNQSAGGQAQGNGQPAAEAPIPSSITGSVTLKDPVAVNPGAKLDLKLVDVANPEVPVAEKSVDVSGSPPFQFQLDLDPAKIDRKRAYTVNAVLTDGERRFLAGLQTPVLTGGSGANVQILLTAEPTAAEKLKDEFAKLQTRIGGMKAVNGTYTTDDASIGWDAFADHGKVVFVRVNTEYDKGGRTAVKYAFVDDKPMFAKQQGGATVGWDANGGVVVNEKQGGGTLNDKELAPIHDAATKAFQMAQEKVDATKKK